MKQPGQNSVILKIRGLNKFFGKKHVIQNLDLDIYRGEVFGFLGPNGAGKTTVMKMIMGFLYPDSGTIEVDGLSLTENYEAAMAKLGGIIENPEMYKEFTGYQNLKFYARSHGPEALARIPSVVEGLRMEGRLQDKVKKYSLGMKQRLGLAQALLHDPDLLVLDEPTNGLDPAGIHELRTYLKTLAREQNKAVFVSSHLLSEMQLICDRVAIIQEGRLIGVEPVSHALGQDQERFGLILNPQADGVAVLKKYFQNVVVEGEEVLVPVGPNEITKVLKNLIESGIQVTGVRQQATSSLETVFLQVTGGGKTIA